MFLSLITALITSLLILFVSDVSAQSITRGPYLQLVTPTSVIIKWRTDRPTDSVAYYGNTLDKLKSTAVSSLVTTEHEVKIAGLNPDTQYFYAVGTASKKLEGGNKSYSFQTSPIPGTSRLTRIWVIGDSGVPRYDASAVRDGYKVFNGNRLTNLWLMLGDNAYPHGTDNEYQKSLFEMYSVLLRQVVLFPTIGDHDIEFFSTSKTPSYFNIFTLPTKAEAGGLPSGTERYYSFDYGNIHFISLDSTINDSHKIKTMTGWLEKDLIANVKMWTIAYWHHPPYSKGSADSDKENNLIEMRKNVLPILEDHGIDLVLSGHSHSYERSFLLFGHYGNSETLQSSMILDSGDGREDSNGAYAKSVGGLNAGKGTVYVVTGSASSVIEGPLNHPAMFLSFNTLGSMVLDIYGNRLDAFFIDEDGIIRDNFTILKVPDNAPPVILATEAIDSKNISILFSKSLDLESSEMTSNYSINNGVNVTRVKLARNRKTVYLSTSHLIEDVNYTLTVNKVFDRSGNAIDSETKTTFKFNSLMNKSFQDGVEPSPNYMGTRDTYISESEPDIIFGDVKVLEVLGDKKGKGINKSSLIYWDISEIPPEAIINSAKITLNVTNPSKSAYDVYEMKKNWKENATWNMYDEANSWEDKGAFGKLDRNRVVLGTVGSKSAGSHIINLNYDGISVIQSWLTGVKPNLGFIITSSSASDTFAFRSREAAAAIQRPKLTVTYKLRSNSDDWTSTEQ